MTAWLQPLRRELDAAAGQGFFAFFFRDDDVGWHDHRLRALLDLFAQRRVPVDLAAIPTAVGPGLARDLRQRAAAAPGRIGIHQHGFSHANHEPEGRRCEFGASRPREALRADIAAGRLLLQTRLGPLVQPVFTPPWNRCGPATGACLVELGIGVLSRDRTAGALAIPGLRELPVRVDWFAKRGGQRLTRFELGELIAVRAREPEPLGLMLHHADMDRAELCALEELLSLLAEHERARCVAMATALDPPRWADAA
jgi:peptidoglycan/xylan/chitin deacetylase (PgdA/CDA1 family)